MEFCSRAKDWSLDALLSARNVVKMAMARYKQLEEVL